MTDQGQTIEQIAERIGTSKQNVTNVYQKRELNLTH